MKILIVNTFYYPNMQGGAEQSVKLLAEGLVEKGHDVAIFCIDSKDGQESETEYNGVKIFRRTSNKFNLYKFSYEKNKVKKIEKIKQKLICYNNKECVKDFKKVCKEFKPDIVHTNTLYGMSEFIWKAAYKLNIPVIHTVRDIGMISPVQYGHHANLIIKKVHQLYNIRLSRYVTGVTAPSEYTLNTTLEIGTFKNAKIKKCIFNSVKIDMKDLEKTLKEKEKRTNKTIKFMYAGRLVYFKGIQHMIEAFELLNNKNCELHICGSGEMSDYVEEKTKKNKGIIYHGKLNNDELKQCYKDSDVLLVPSYWPEPFGRVLIEGNMYGLPTIVGNCGGMPEIIKNTQAGEIYNPGNKQELKEKMEQMLERKQINSYIPNIKKNIGIYDISHQIKNFEKVYKELIKK